MFKILTVTVVMTDRLKRKEENEGKWGNIDHASVLQKEN